MNNRVRHILYESKKAYWITMIVMLILTGPLLFSGVNRYYLALNDFETSRSPLIALTTMGKFIISGFHYCLSDSYNKKGNHHDRN